MLGMSLATATGTVTAVTAPEGATLPKVYESGGIYYVAALHERQTPDMTLFEREKTHISETILQIRRGELWDGYVDALVKRASVSITLPGLPKEKPEEPVTPTAPDPMNGSSTVPPGGVTSLQR